MGPQQLFLAHQDERTESSRGKITTTTTRYSVYPLPLNRPPAGMTMTMIRCGKCGWEMRWKVYSAPLARRRRRWTKACGGVVLACAIAGVPALWTLAGLDAPVGARMAGVALAMMTPVNFGVGMVLLEVPGIKGVRLRGGGLTHSVRDNDATVVTTQATKTAPPRR